MRLRTTLIAIITALASSALPAGAFQLPPGGTFVDDNGSVHEGYIEAIAALGITKGCNPPANDRYCPDDAVTRGQMAAFLVRALGLTATTENRFTDDDGSIFEGDIDRLAEAAITLGCNPPLNDRYCPEAAVTRGQMAALLVRAFGYVDGGGANRFTDDDGSIFEDDIDRLAAAGVTLGCNPPANDRYCPANTVTRAQMASFLGRAMMLTPTVPPPPDLPPAGNPDGTFPVPAEAQAEDTSSPDVVIGNGTAASCTSAAVVAAVAQGGVIVFDCGPNPVTIAMTETARIFNDTGPQIVIDGAGLVTLSGGGDTRILYMNTCDQSLVWTTPNCDDQDHPQLTVQNLTFVEGNATGEDPDGGGAIFVRGGRFKVVSSRFFSNQCDPVGPDVGGAAIRVFDQHDDLPVYVSNSTFGGAPGLGNVCSNGGGLSSIGVSWTVINSLFTHNEAIGAGANPAQPGTPGGGSGGAIYNDGNTLALTVAGTKIEDNHANEGGGAIFFVSNDRTGTLVIEDSELRRNPSDGFETVGYPGIFFLGNGDPQVINSVIE
jgi:hypothetical protein